MTILVLASVVHVHEFLSAIDPGRQPPENPFVRILSAVGPELRWGPVRAAAEGVSSHQMGVAEVGGRQSKRRGEPTSEPFPRGTGSVTGQGLTPNRGDEREDLLLGMFRMREQPVFRNESHSNNRGAEEEQGC